jgi:hypothetical protein
MSRAAVLSRLHNSLGIEKFCLRWVAHHLIDDPRQVRVAKCNEFLGALEAIQ